MNAVCDCTFLCWWFLVLYREVQIRAIEQAHSIDFSTVLSLASLRKKRVEQLCSFNVTIHPAQNKRATPEFYETWGRRKYPILLSRISKLPLGSTLLFPSNDLWKERVGDFSRTIWFYKDDHRTWNTAASVGKQFSFSLRTESSCVFMSVAKRCCYHKLTN